MRSSDLYRIAYLDGVSGLAWGLYLSVLETPSGVPVMLPAKPTGAVWGCTPHGVRKAIKTLMDRKMLILDGDVYRAEPDPEKWTLQGNSSYQKVTPVTSLSVVTPVTNSEENVTGPVSGPKQVTPVTPPIPSEQLQLPKGNSSYQPPRAPGSTLNDRLIELDPKESINQSSAPPAKPELRKAPPVDDAIVNDGSLEKQEREAAALTRKFWDGYDDIDTLADSFSQMAACLDDQEWRCYRVAIARGGLTFTKDHEAVPYPESYVASIYRNLIREVEDGNPIPAMPALPFRAPKISPQEKAESDARLKAAREKREAEEAERERLEQEQIDRFKAMKAEQERIKKELAPVREKEMKEFADAYWKKRGGRPHERKAHHDNGQSA